MDKQAAETIANALVAGLVSPNVPDANAEPANIVDAMWSVAQQLKWLGNGDASTTMGAIEGHGAAVIEAADKIADAVDNLAEAVRETAKAGDP